MNYTTYDDDVPGTQDAGPQQAAVSVMAPPRRLSPSLRAIDYRDPYQAPSGKAMSQTGSSSPMTSGSAR